MIENEDHARAWLKALPACDAAAFDRLECLVARLREENARQNLVADASLAHVWQRHIADSAQLLAHVPRETIGPWLDLGTGAGFPGVVIAILRHETTLLVESRRKRADWLSQMCEDLDLGHAIVEARRLEAVPTRDVAVISARAFAPLEKLVALSTRFSTGGTYWLLPKGRSAAHELKQLQNHDHMFHVEQSLTDSEAGIIVGRLDSRKAD